MHSISRPLLVLIVAESVLAWSVPLPAQSWTLTTAPITNWTCVASSADGMKLVAGANAGYSGTEPGPLYRSDDAGGSWIQTAAPIAAWASVASSGDGTTLIAAAGYDGALFVSTNAGAHWVDRTPDSGFSVPNFRAVACSPDARLLVTANSFVGHAGFGSQIFVSTNLGVDWTTGTLREFVESISCAGDGKTILVGALGNLFIATYVSTNSGVAWSGQYAGGDWDSVACSVDGSRLVAIAGRGSITPVYFSQDAGGTWTEITNADTGFNPTATLAMSADGKRCVIAIGGPNAGGPIITTSDAGLNWDRTDAPVTNWTSVASSADGHFFVATAQGWSSGGPIYVGRSVPAPILSITPSDTTLLLSWMIPSMPFVLLQSPGLNAGWKDVPATPVHNYTNLRCQVSLPKPDGTAFYRLVSR